MKQSIIKMNQPFVRNLKGRTIKYEDSRTGKSITSIDKKRSALPPGKRISKSGKIYYEKRVSRSDLIGKKV